MARHEQDREDLLAEATALVERVSLRLAGEADEIVAGFRRDGSLSLYFGADRVYQFTSDGKLRRAFAAGEMLKAQAGKLVALRRERTADAVHLLSRELDEAATRVLLDEMRRSLEQLADCLHGGTFELIGQVPPDVNVAGRVHEWLSRNAATITIAAGPR